MNENGGMPPVVCASRDSRWPFGTASHVCGSLSCCFRETLQRHDRTVFLRVDHRRED